VKLGKFRSQQASVSASSLQPVGVPVVDDEVDEGFFLQRREIAAAIRADRECGCICARRRCLASWNKYQVDLESCWRGFFVFLPSL
jgi:hypothetical protein